MKIAPFILFISVLWIGLYIAEREDRQIIISVMFLCTTFIVAAIEKQRKNS